MSKQATKKKEKLYNACEKKRCAAQTKRNNILKKKYKKREKAMCASLTDNGDFYNCSKKYYAETGYDKSFEELSECGSKYCAKEKKARAQAYLAMGGATKKKPYEQWDKMDAEWYHLNRKKTKCLKKKCDTKEYLLAEKNFNKAEKKKCPKSLPREERLKCTPPVDPIYDKLDAENSLCYKRECEKERNAVEKIDKEIDSVAAAKRDFYNSAEGKEYAMAKLKKLQPKIGKIVEQALNRTKKQR
jgi:hypothetical protein